MTQESPTTEPNAAVAVEPCPMCGNNDPQIIKCSDKVHPYQIRCTSCGTMTAYHGSFQGAWKAWNTRIAAENRVREGAGENRFYIDCEFDGHGGPLLSIALVGENDQGIHIEADVRARDPWVLANVVPLLDQHDAPDCIRVAPNEVGSIIRSFIGDCQRPVIIADSPVDIGRFCAAISTGDDGGWASAEYPHMTFEVHNVDCYPTDLPGAVQHNAWWDATALRRKLASLPHPTETRRDDAGGEMSFPNRERLEDERHELENSYGYGPYHDGLVRQRIEAIDAALAPAPQTVADYERVIAGLNKQLTEQFELTSKQAAQIWALSQTVASGDERIKALEEALRCIDKIETYHLGDNPGHRFTIEPEIRREYRTIARAALSNVPQPAPPSQREANAVQELFRLYQENGKHTWEADVVGCGCVRIEMVAFGLAPNAIVAALRGDGGKR